MSRPVSSRPLIAAELLILVLLGFAGNYAKVTLFLNVDLIFGSLITMVIVLRHGVVLGTMAGVVIASYTYVLWNHPYAIVIFGLEALVVGLLHRRYKTGNIILYDAAYWLCLGMPLVFVFYRLVMGLDLAGTAVIMLKQATNGIVNATLAIGLSVAAGVVVKLLRGERTRGPSVHLQTALSSLMVALSTIPPLILITILSRGVVRDTEHELIDHLERAAETIVAASSTLLPDDGVEHGVAADGTVEALQTLASRVGVANGVDTLLISPEGEIRPRNAVLLPGDHDGIQVSEISSNCDLVIPPARANVTVMDRWARTVAITDVTLPRLPGWQVQLQAGFGQYQAQLHRRLLINLSIMALFVFAGVFTSTFFGRAMGRRIVSLSHATDGLSLGAGKPEALPSSSSAIYEVAALEQNFKEAGEAIGSQFEQLIEAREEARSADEAKSRFLANMSHEIRNPMNGVLGMLQLLERHELSPEARGYLRAARSSAETLLTVINDVLDLSKIRAGRMEMKNEPFEVVPLVEEIVRAFEPSAIATTIPLRWSVDESLPRRLVGDAIRIRQILFNLIGNAYKFTDAGEVRLDVTGEAAERDGTRTVTFLVTDTGCGIPAEEICRMKDPFVQGESGYQKKAQGTGLGLTIVARLTELMDGELSLESHVGSGTRVRVSLPLAEAREPVAPVAGVTVDWVDADNSIGEREERIRVLLVEDNSINRLALSKELEYRGYVVATAHDGVDAIDRLKGEEFDIVLMDIQMPVMDGLECTRRIRAGEAGTARDVPIVALTGYALQTEREEFKAAGVDAQVSKPIVYPILERQIQGLLGVPKERPGE